MLKISNESAASLQAREQIFKELEAAVRYLENSWGFIQRDVDAVADDFIAQAKELLEIDESKKSNQKIVDLFFDAWEAAMEDGSKWKNTTTTSGIYCSIGRRLLDALERGTKKNRYRIYRYDCRFA